MSWREVSEGGIINGVIYGVIIWVVFSLAKMVYDRGRGKKQIVIEAEVKNNQLNKVLKPFLYPFVPDNC